MLVEMSVANFRSFNEKQTFSLVKGKGDELESNVINDTSVKGLELLRSAVIYGANASGKSNFLEALRAMRRVVLKSASAQRGDKLSLVPFRLMADSRSQPSELEVTFIADGVRYQYGFSATPERIMEEWLLAYPKGRAQTWFDRAWNAEQNEYEWQFSNFLVGKKQIWQKSTRDNALFLSTAVQLNSQQLQPIFDWFKETLRFENVGGWSPVFSASLCANGEKNKILDFLNAADLNIDGIVVEKSPLPRLYLRTCQNLYEIR